jgi:hypothetical protein
VGWLVAREEGFGLGDASLPLPVLDLTGIRTIAEGIVQPTIGPEGNNCNDLREGGPAPSADMAVGGISVDVEIWAGACCIWRLCDGCLRVKRTLMVKRGVMTSFVEIQLEGALTSDRLFQRVLSSKGLS